MFGWMDGVYMAFSSQQRDNGISCATMGEREKGVESPDAYVDD